MDTISTKTDAAKSVRLYEHLTTPPISRVAFAKRIIKHFALSASILGIFLLLGMSGYSYFEGLDGQDAFLNAAMILSGMGPVLQEFRSTGGKIFAGIYALLSGLLFVVVVGIMLSPVLHRVLHRFHWPDA